jgi:hypothetical protein
MHMLNEYLRSARKLIFLQFICGCLAATNAAEPAEDRDRKTPPPAPLEPIVEAEESVYSFTPANNGAGPMWCHGSTCLVRIGEDVFASGLETLADAKPLNNCRWMLFRRSKNGWEKLRVDEKGRTREPSPLAGFSDGRLFLSANPTLVESREQYSGPARPEILQFSAASPKTEPQTILPVWNGSPHFTEHSYRSFAADGANRELLLLQNIDYTHAEWAFRDRNGQWTASGQLKWPYGAEYEKPEPIRVCYPNVALTSRSVHFCGVSDIIEPNSAWRAYKKQLTGQNWDYDFRRLFYTWSTDILAGRFEPWIEISSREKTAGWITPGDLWVAPDGAAHIIWNERALDERLKAKFFPDAKQSHSLNYAIVRNGKVLLKKALIDDTDGGEIAGRGRFQPTPDKRLFVFYYISGRSAKGESISENRLMEIYPDGSHSDPQKVALKLPFADFFTATPRAGSPPSLILDVLGHRAGESDKMSYAQIRLRPRT